AFPSANVQTGCARDCPSPRHGVAPDASSHAAPSARGEATHTGGDDTRDLRQDTRCRESPATPRGAAADVLHVGSRGLRTDWASILRSARRNVESIFAGVIVKSFLLYCATYAPVPQSDAGASGHAPCTGQV
ncbi:Hypothetical protein, putative, partial [Bodo saltans]